MAKATKKYSKPLTLDMDFDEALGRFAQVAPGELVARADGPVHLREDDTGARFLIYATDRGVRHELRYEGGQPWFTQKQLADMFGVTVPSINEHIQKFVMDGELATSTIRNFRIVRTEGARQVEREITHYSLDVAFYVGYRVNSAAGVLFRKWATAILIQFATKGFVVDKEHLMNRGEPDVLDEFRDIARQIRTSVRNSYREVLRLCTLCADYDGSSASAREFFMGMENKLLWAAANKTAPQLILERADAEAADMGLTYYAGKRGPTQKDVVVGNNYLAPGEQERKGRITEMWLTYVEEQLDQGKLPTMAAVTDKLDGFIKFNGWRLLTGFGHHSRGDANRHALEQLELFRQRQQAELEAGDEVAAKLKRKKR